MTWFRAGGAGIPASLKNNMNSVLNKKFGTTGQNYPPNGWPDDVNLLGLLPIKTATGAIASFYDGADDVPISDGTFYIAPSQSGTGTPSPSNPRPIVGYTGMTINQTGKNFISLLDWLSAGYSYSTNGVTFTVQSDGGIRIQGKSTSTSDFSILALAQKTFYAPQNGEYTISASGIVANVKLITSGANNNGFPYKEVTSTNTSQTGTVTDSTKPFNYLLVRVIETVNTLDIVIYPQLEVGSTATTYEAYKAKTPIVDAFGRTIYGGERKTDGTLTESYAKVLVSGLSWTFYQPASGLGYCYATLSDKVQTAVGDTEHPLVCSMLEYGGCNYASQFTDVKIWQTGNKNIYLVDSSCADKNAYMTKYGNAEIAYPLATPNEYSLSPISLNTYYGDNNVWCDTGDTQLNYRADIDKYINNHIH